jgi:hypothetical protein
VLVASGITTTGKPAWLGLDGTSAESHEACVGFLRDLVARGLRAPLLVISDGTPGLISAIEQVFPLSLRQRCLVHRAGNVLAKVSATDREQVKADFWAIFDAIDASPGQPAVEQARRHAERFADTWAARYPRAAQVVLDELPYLTAPLRFPREHWRRIRHTNLLERPFARESPPGEGPRPAARGALLPGVGVGGPGPGLGRLAGRGHEPCYRPAAPTTPRRAASSGRAPTRTDDPAGRGRHIRRVT